MTTPEVTITLTAPILALRLPAAAKCIGVGERKLWELTKGGEIKATKIGACVVYRVEELARFLASREQ